MPSSNTDSELNGPLGLNRIRVRVFDYVEITLFERDCPASIFFWSRDLWPSILAEFWRFLKISVAVKNDTPILISIHIQLPLANSGNICIKATCKYQILVFFSLKGSNPSEMKYFEVFHRDRGEIRVERGWNRGKN